jgi:hypothetical protein
MSDHLTLCSEERLRELLRIEQECIGLRAFSEIRRVQINELMDEVEKLKLLGTALCTEATPWADVGGALDCATNRACLRHAIEEFLKIGYDGISTLNEVPHD